MNIILSCRLDHMMLNPSGLCKMNGLELSEEELEEASKDIMTTIDEDGDGDVTKEEFVKNALKNDFIRSIIG